jgi:glycosyltransferase involved in cell wall biosynthesis
MRSPRLVSVIVPTYHAGPELGKQLAALSDQDYQGTVEVIVADNGAPRWQSRSASGWARACPGARVIDASARRGPGAARNAGARAAEGDFFAFCDADDEVSPSWLRHLVDTAAHADLVGGSFESGRLNSALACGCYDVADPAAPHLGFLPAAAGANLGVWADVFFALGGFDECSRAGEDVALTWDAQLRGYVYAPSPAIVHKRFPGGLRDAARRFFHYGIGDAWLYRHYRVAGMPRRDRAELMGVTLALIIGFAGAPGPPPVRRCRWNLMLWLTCGRLVGSIRHRVVFV